MSEYLVKLFKEALRQNENIEYLNQLAETRRRDESWLINLLIKQLSKIDKAKSIKRNKYYPDSWETCDLFFAIEPHNYWIEVKTLPTNYCGGCGRPITDFIKIEVKMALYKLGKVKNGKNKCMLVAAFYPFCNSEREAEEWDTHLGRIYKFCDAFLQSYELEEEKISLGGWKAKIYFIWC